MVAPASNSNTWKAEAGGLQLVQGPPGLHSGVAQGFTCALQRAIPPAPFLLSGKNYNAAHGCFFGNDTHSNIPN